MNVSFPKFSIACRSKRRGIGRLLTLTVLIAFGGGGWSGNAFATHAPPGTVLWAYEAALAGARILEYDISSDTFVASCVPDAAANGRGIAFDPVDSNLWYTRIPGDGLIHKVTSPPACTPVATIPFADGPGGTVQDDIGALDVDPDDGNLWATGYEGIGGQFGPGPIVLYKVNRATGAIINSCTVPKGDNFNQNDTLTEAKLSGLPGSGSYLITDAGEFDAGVSILVVDEASCTGGGPGTVVATYPNVFGMTGADYELGALFTTNLSSIYNLNNPPFGAAVATMSAAPSTTLEDITLNVVASLPATLTLQPKTATNTVGAQHCVTATVIDPFGNATPAITVRFSVTGSVSTSGSATTTANGQATFCYTGPALPGSDVVTAYADTNKNGVKDASEPSDTAMKSWVLPPSTRGCKVTYGGRILAANGDKATFGGNAKVPASGPKGQEQYRDHGGVANLNVHSLNVLAVICSANVESASIFGRARVKGSGSVEYRIDVTDNGEPGAGSDTYRIRLSTGYDSGDQTLVGGNIQLH
jgi:hypothetical protein